MDYIFTFSSYISFYTIMKNYLPEKYSNKARVFVSLVNSAFLSCLSYYTFNNLTLYPLSYFIKDQPDQTWLANYTIGYFAADLFLGHLFDRKNLNLLTGYIHHSVFIIMTYHVKITNQSNIIYLLVPFEIPTFFLDVTHIYKHSLIDNSFGITFLTFRIFYNLYVIYSLWQYYIPYSLISCLLLVIHLNWFQKWLQKMKKSNNIIYV